MGLAGDGVGQATDLGGGHLVNWCLAVDHVVDGIGRLSIFRPLLGMQGPAAAGDGCLVRVLFEDRSRFECLLPATDDGLPSPPTASDTFRLLDSQGTLSRRSFGEPLGCEWHTEIVRRLLACLTVNLDAERAVVETSSSLVHATHRRAEVLLKLHGAMEDLSSGAETAPLLIGQTLTSVSQALRQSREACNSIEATLGPGSRALLKQCSASADGTGTLPQKKKKKKEK